MNQFRPLQRVYVLRSLNGAQSLGLRPKVTHKLNPIPETRYHVLERVEGRVQAGAHRRKVTSEKGITLRKLNYKVTILQMSEDIIIICIRT